MQSLARKHLPEAPEGWARRGYDEGDNTAVIPAGQKTTGAYGREHPLTQFKNETFANFKNLKHVYKKEVSGQSDEDFHLGMLQASTYVYEKGDETVLIELLKKAHSGDKAYSSVVASYLSDAASREDIFDQLTEREMQILQEVAKGYRNKQIADQLFISESTVKVHMKSLLKKLQVASRTAATVLYLERYGEMK